MAILHLLVVVLPLLLVAAAMPASHPIEIHIVLSCKLCVCRGGGAAEIEPFAYGQGVVCMYSSTAVELKLHMLLVQLHILCIQTIAMVLHCELYGKYLQGTVLKQQEVQNIATVEAGDRNGLHSPANKPDHVCQRNLIIS